MRVAIDFSAAVNQGAGIGRYARNVIANAMPHLPEATFALWYAPEPGSGARYLEIARAMLPASAPHRLVGAPFDRRRADQLWFRARLPIPIELWTGRADLVYSPDFTAPCAMRTPSIVTVHDLAFEIVPERAPQELRRYLSSIVPRQVAKAAAVVAVSETTKRDLVDRLGVSANRIRVIPNAADMRFFEAQPLDKADRTRIGLPERYLLTVGTLEPRKNHQTLFEAIRRVPEAVATPLVIVGRTGWDAGPIVQEARALASDNRAIVLDYVDDALLPGLYAGATALIYPSWYEGFGLPVVEGLAAGIRVIASRVPAHVEVAGDDAVYVDPADPQAIAVAVCEAIRSAADGEAVRARRRMRARRYAWSRSGALLAELMQSVAK